MILIACTREKKLTYINSTVNKYKLPNGKQITFARMA